MTRRTATLDVPAGRDQVFSPEAVKRFVGHEFTLREDVAEVIGLIPQQSLAPIPGRVRVRVVTATVRDRGLLAHLVVEEVAADG